MELYRACRRTCLGFALCLMLAGQIHAAPLNEQAVARAEAGALQYLLDHMAEYHSDGDYYEVGGDLLRLQPAGKGARFVPSFELPAPDPAAGASAKDEPVSVYDVLTKYKRVFVYDLAVETCALVLAGKREEARGLLLALESVQLPDGSLPFSFNAGGDNFMNYSYLRSGSIAWAGYAAVFWERETGDHSFRTFASRIAKWLLDQQVPGESDRDYRAGLPLGGYGQWATDYSSLVKGRREWACTEHAIDSYFFLRLYANTAPAGDPSRVYCLQAADRIKRALVERLWVESKDGFGRFYQGVDRQQLNMGKALDCASWGALFLLAIGETAKAEAAVRYAEATFATTFRPSAPPAVGSVQLYRPYAGKNDEIEWDDYPDLVWAEGSLGVALAYLRLGRRDKFDAIVTDVLKLCAVPGDPATGVRYARYQQDLRGHRGGDIGTRDFIKDFTRAPSAMCTAWLVLVLESVAKEPNLNKFWGPD